MAYGLHHDQTPSLQLYDDGTWCCFAGHGSEGRIGGSIYDFGGRLWSLDTKGREFLELRQRLADTLLPASAPEARSGDRPCSLPAQTVSKHEEGPKCPASEKPR